MILIAGALEDEINPFVESLSERKEVSWLDYKFFNGRFNGLNTVVAATGTGKVMTSLVLQHLFDVYPFGRMFFTGTAGGLDPDFIRGDIVACVDCVQHDMDCTFFGYPPGQSSGSFPGVLESDKEMLGICNSFSPKGYRFHTGRILTGDRFVGFSGEREELRRKFNGDLVDMESAAAALTAGINGIPWLVIKAVSDSAGGEILPGFRKFARRSAIRIMNVIRHVLNNLPNETTD